MSEGNDLVEDFIRYDLQVISFVGFSLLRTRERESYFPGRIDANEMQGREGEKNTARAHTRALTIDQERKRDIAMHCSIR